MLAPVVTANFAALQFGKWYSSPHETRHDVTRRRVLSVTTQSSLVPSNATTTPQDLTVQKTALLVLTALFSSPLFAQAIDSVPSPRLCRELLQRSLVEFYLPHSIDQEFGGYHEEVDAQGRFVGGAKFLTLQARQLWFFSALASRGIEREASLDAAASGYEFLRKHFLDPERGGYFLKTHQDGRPLDTHKHVYPNAFVIYGLVE